MSLNQQFSNFCEPLMMSFLLCKPSTKKEKKTMSFSDWYYRIFSMHNQLDALDCSFKQLIRKKIMKGNMQNIALFMKGTIISLINQSSFFNVIALRSLTSFKWFCFSNIILSPTFIKQLCKSVYLLKPSKYVSFNFNMNLELHTIISFHHK